MRSIVSCIQIRQQGTWQFISAALLQDKNNIHELLDDQESALHLLTWIALHYTAHNLEPDNLDEFMEMFDETFTSTQGVGGGRLKERALTRKRIKHVWFTGRPQLDALLLELTELIAPRYLEPPSEATVILHESMLKTANLSDEMSKATFPLLWQRHHFADPGWLVSTIRRHLQDRGAWLAVDKPITHPMGKKRKKRKSAKSNLNVSQHGKRMKDMATP